MNDAITLQQIKDARAKITPAPWVYMTDETFGGEIRSCGASEDDPSAFSHIADTPEMDDRPDDMEWIAHSPEYVDWLIAELETVIAERDKLREALGEKQ